MKLIIAGATGFVAEEVVRQSLRRPEITSVIALSRRAVKAPDDTSPGFDASKLRSVIVKDYDDYPEEVKKEFQGAHACIWTVSITPTKSRMYDFAEVVRVCQTSTVAGLNAMYEAGLAKPFRFLYMSGEGCERDQAKAPARIPFYALMRGETENRVLAFAAEHPGEIEAGVARPGLITAQGYKMRTMFATALKWVQIVPSIDRADLTAVMLEQVINGFEKDPLQNNDLERIAKRLNGTTA